MTLPTWEILDDIRQTLQASGQFQSVSIGPDAISGRLPRAELLLNSCAPGPADDRADATWWVLKADVVVHVQASGQGGALERALQLADAAQAALRVDGYRGGLCLDLPIGRATELGPVRPEPAVKSPYLALSFEIRCHFEA